MQFKLQRFVTSTSNSISSIHLSNVSIKLLFMLMLSIYQFNPRNPYSICNFLTLALIFLKVVNLMYNLFH